MHTATIATYPFDYTRTSYAANMGNKKQSLIAFMTKTVKEKGVRGFYAGSGPAMAGIVPLMGINFCVYESLMARIEEGKSVNAGLAGAISGGLSKVLVYPLDTVKKRLQNQAFGGVGGYKGAVDCGMTIVREEGFRTLYRGLAPTVVKSMVGTGLTFAFFNATRSSMVGEWERRQGVS